MFYLLNYSPAIADPSPRPTAELSTTLFQSQVATRAFAGSAPDGGQKARSSVRPSGHTQALGP